MILPAGLQPACSFELNKAHGNKVLEWQRGFGVVSFGKGNLPWVLEYVRFSSPKG